MIWAARHIWPSCAQFLFNTYKHWGQLHIHSSDGNSSLIHSKEGVTQGDPLAMTAYGIGILPLIKHLQLEFPELLHIWYADDASIMGKQSQILQFFECISFLGPDFGYFPAPKNVR